MNPIEFSKKWSQTTLSESQASRDHFNDLCDLVGHGKPSELDPTGQSFCFEKGATKEGGGNGRADVWKSGFFGWEYKGKKKDLEAAYAQLLLYRDQLENPPLLVVSDMDRIIVRTNYTGTKAATYEISLATLGEPRSLEILRAVFFEPGKLRPGMPSRTVTEEAAGSIGKLAESLRNRGLEPSVVARFLDRMVFCFFAEDVGLLPGNLVTRIIENSVGSPETFAKAIAALFEAMQAGGLFGADVIPPFNGDLFNDALVLPLRTDELAVLLKAARLDWDAVDPSILGTLFERGLDPSKRSQLGAHYTSREDIETLVEPVVMRPLREEWAEVRSQAEHLLDTGRLGPESTGKALSAKAAREQAEGLVWGFQRRLGQIRVLDPACGSGNFLYVTLQKLKDLEKDVLVFAYERFKTMALHLVNPTQFFGIEINEYAFHLAQLTLWIGYLQWMRANGFSLVERNRPVLQRLSGFQQKDSILDLADPSAPKEPEWPEADFIVGNPPFLGSKRMRGNLGDSYVDSLFAVWGNRVRCESDLCVYWFEKARAQVSASKAKRVGLLATQAIRGGANREVLASILASGGVFFAISDRDWVLDGANVHVSMVGFDAGRDKGLSLDGRQVGQINSDLTSGVDLTRARRLHENAGVAFMGTTKGGAFDIPAAVAKSLLPKANPHGRPNSDVLVPWGNGKDVTSRVRNLWIVDYGVGMPEAGAAKYEEVFELVKRAVLPARQAGSRELGGEMWWQHVRSRPEMRQALVGLSRFIVTVRVSKYRLFVWSRPPCLPDSAVIVFASSDDTLFGVLHSRVHETWARMMGTQVRERESGFRYTPTTCFETFPLPCGGPEQMRTIARAARELHELREHWLNPVEWTRDDVTEFRASLDGPWAAMVVEPDSRGVGTVRYATKVPVDEGAAKELEKRTLTNLYNRKPAWLTMAHEALDRAVFAAYGWDWPLPDEVILERLLELNLERAGADAIGGNEGGDDCVEACEE